MPNLRISSNFPPLEWAGLTTHFRAGVLPANYSWLNTGNVGGVACATPASATLAFNGDYLYAYPASTKVSFLQAAKTYSAGKSLYGRFGLDMVGIVGLRLDRNNDTDFFETYLADAGGGVAKLYTRYRDAGGAVVPSAGVAVPASLMYSLRLRLIDTTFLAGYVCNEAGAQITLDYHVFSTAWSGSVRAGLAFLSTGGGAGVCDAYYCEL